MVTQQLNQCNAELIKHAQSPSALSSLPSKEILDTYLKVYVRLQQSYLLKRIDKQLFSYKADICVQKLHCQLFMYHLTTSDQGTIEQLVHLRQVQMQVYEELTMLKERIRYQFLSTNFDQLGEYIAPDYYWPPIADRTLVETKTKRRKIVQQAKRKLLNIYIFAYEMKIYHYEEQYQQALNELELKFASNKTTIAGQSLLNAVKAYMVYRTERIKGDIFQKTAHFRQIIARRRQRSSVAKKALGVSPQVTIDVLHHTLNEDELTYLSLGKIVGFSTLREDSPRWQ